MNKLNYETGDYLSGGAPYRYMYPIPPSIEVAHVGRCCFLYVAAVSSRLCLIFVSCHFDRRLIAFLADTQPLQQPPNSMMRSASLILSSSVRSVTSRRLPLAAGIGVSADPATSSSAPVRSTRPFSSAAQPCPEDCGTPCPEDCVGSDGNFLAGGSEQTDFFKILGVERQFAIDEKALKSTYRHLMAQYHPDRHHSLKTPDELESLTDMSSSITRAYGVLTDPHSRAEHLLELMGGPITENCGNLVADGSLLMDVMEIREEIDDAEEDAEVLRTLMEQNAKRMGDTCMELADAFEKNDLEEARKLTSRLQYWKRIEEKIVDKLSTVR